MFEDCKLLHKTAAKKKSQQNLVETMNLGYPSPPRATHTHTRASTCYCLRSAPGPQHARPTPSSPKTLGRLPRETGRNAEGT